MEELNMWAFQEERNEVITALHKEGSVRNVEVSIRDIEGNYKTVLYSADIIDYVGEKHVLSAAIGHNRPKTYTGSAHKNRDQIQGYVYALDTGHCGL